MATARWATWVTDIAPFTLGVASGNRRGTALIQGLFSPIIERGTVLPVSRVERFRTLDQDQTELLIEVYQGEHSLCAKNQKLGQYQLTGIPTGPAGAQVIEGVLYEVVALSCVTETLSTALLAELVARARDQVCRGAMHEILRDEVKHSRLGWALLAEEHARGVRDCVGRHLPQMLRDTLGPDFFDSQTPLEPCATELAGLGFLERPERQRVVQETLEHVIFPGLERFGVDTALGRRWLAGFDLRLEPSTPT